MGKGRMPIAQARRLQGDWGIDVPEEVEEPERLDDDADERPLEEHEQDAADEAHRAAQLLLPREEVERLVGPDDERQPGQEEDLSRPARSGRQRRARGVGEAWAWAWARRATGPGWGSA